MSRIVSSRYCSKSDETAEDATSVALDGFTAKVSIAVHALNRKHAMAMALDRISPIPTIIPLVAPDGTTDLPQPGLMLALDIKDPVSFTR
ncbi:hypothetical protein RE411_23570 (plasmid) [Agrobacterium pusense]|uniref:hypothetical protein n=1 Tax=Agrobacterium TaxID=357 RepID=UPI0018D431A4|nr:MULTISPECIES: hypothetical protein [Agrobacterium]MBW9075620.1 hypothetical protein [Agrobacterium deltaense]WMW59138.1 hypothetical protein RE411_23570 [Agrobacterium pusense]